MGYIGLANKYRPRLLNEIVGQDFLVKCLSASIAKDEVAGAILLSGPYGTGKTTTARAVTLSLLCLNRIDVLPCLKCDSCVSVMNGSHPDVLEIDAASNTGVEDIRMLVEGALYKPLLSKCKSYIVDEVHMLSQSAFNALLKLLEEPPQYVKFFLATTELQKIPATIISRCQHYRLSRLSMSIITERLTQVAEKEQIGITQDAVKFIAEKSDGSLRDALSLLEQVALHPSEEKITIHVLRNKMGLADLSEINSLLDSIIAGNCKTSLDKLNDMYSRGHEVLTIFMELLALTNQKIQDKLTAKDDSRSSFFCRLAQCMLSSIEEVKSFNCDYNVAELAVIRMSYMADLPSPGEIVKIFSNETCTTASTDSGISKSNDANPSELIGYILKEFDGSKLLD
ncbi:DNA polymerase III subunit gamma/tau [Neorickettsia findlayensis]|uniref:DNA polymerase III subunit gamma/tau n=1 Tax=Neorickettsia findlayensis TaxID=2686014 RepID=A0A6P1GA41_9RICK|nr:DNA polymerase III subunit gamma/tau [Neorickettsia findlayensis]QHD65215.1 DNA polymerase III subunit gamma/tau [Neorickettsia findlayensis]